MQNVCSELETELDPAPAMGEAVSLAMGKSKGNFKEDDFGRQGRGRAEWRE